MCFAFQVEERRRKVFDLKSQGVTNEEKASYPP